MEVFKTLTKRGKSSSFIYHTDFDVYCAVIQFLYQDYSRKLNTSALGAQKTEMCFSLFLRTMRFFHRRKVFRSFSFVQLILYEDFYSHLSLLLKQSCFEGRTSITVLNIPEFAKTRSKCNNNINNTLQYPNEFCVPLSAEYPACTCVAYMAYLAEHARDVSVISVFLFVFSFMLSFGNETKHIVTESFVPRRPESIQSKLPHPLLNPKHGVCFFMIEGITGVWCQLLYSEA